MNDEMATTVEAALAQPVDRLADSQPSRAQDWPADGQPSRAPADRLADGQPSGVQARPGARPAGLMGGGDLLDEARRTVNRLIRGIGTGAGGFSAEPPSSAPNMSIADMMKQQKRGTHAAPPDRLPERSYDYGGTRILLGDDVDMNDAEAVQKRMSETNELIDMMNSVYEMEG